MDNEVNNKIKVIEAELNKTKDQTRPSEFTFSEAKKQGLSPVLDKTGKSKTIVVTTTIVEAQLIDLHT